MQIPLRIRLLVVGAALMLLHYYLPIPYPAQVTVLMLVLLVMGIPHGALDFFLDQKISNTRTLRHTVLFLSRYLLNMLGYAVIWYLAPPLAIVLFILLTAYHFGEIDWLGKVRRRGDQFFYFLLGLSWIVFLLSKHIDEAVDIFVLLGQSRQTAAYYQAWAGVLLPLSFISLWILHGILLVYHQRFFEDRRALLMAMVQIVVLSLINVLLPLWLCFTFYFGVWHSVLSFDVLRMEFGIPNTWKGWGQLFRKAVPYSLVAWTGILLFIRFQLQELDLTHFFQLLFMGIAILALPHLQVFTKIKVAQ